MQVEGLVKAAVEGEGAQLKALWSNTLHSPDDLPFRLQDLPQNFGEPGGQAGPGGVSGQMTERECQTGRLSAHFPFFLPGRG